MVEVHAPYAVPSIHSFHADLPDDLAVTLSLHASLEQNDRITPANVKDAEAAVVKLEAFRNEEPVITEAVVQTAKDRAHSLHTIVSQTKFPNPVDNTEILALLRRIDEGQRQVVEGQHKLEEGQHKLEEGQLKIRHDMDVGFRLVDIRQDNRRLTALNEGKIKDQPPLRFMMRKKVVIGEGQELARSIAVRESANIVAKGASDIGSVWKEGLVTIAELTTNEVLDIVRFYNEDFGIEKKDQPAARITKIITWLMGGGPL
ncbi:hypothetical protein B0H21DRAFT_761327 [Amylocystis lapponica]|nr:hypothetical protein B0H21DRAFT_761327 [Amylocystis lapponica]